jgi:hypothetical protein
MGHAYGYVALAIELLAYAAQMVYLPLVSRKYGTLSLTAMYYSIASIATAATLVAREHNDISQVRRFDVGSLPRVS